MKRPGRAMACKRTFAPPEKYELPSAASSWEEKLIVAALKRCGGDGMPSRSLQREAGLSDKNAFYDALHSLKDKGEITVDKDHWVKLIPRGGDIEAQIVSLSERWLCPAQAGRGGYLCPRQRFEGRLRGGHRHPHGPAKAGQGSQRPGQAHCGPRPEEPMTGTVHMDEEGKRVTPDGSLRYDLSIAGSLNGAKDKDKVLIKPLQDSRGDWTQAEILSVFGTGERARVCADAIIVRCGIPTEFPPEVMVQAEEISKMTVTQEDIDQRLDLRDEPIFTIDSADAKDLDDAISVHKTVDGYTLGVHIADVSHYVKAGTPIDQEAFRRGTSVYFADRVIPMLPEALSNGVCSLNAGTEKLTFSALMDFDNEGNMLDYRFEKAVINSKVRGVYAEVNTILDGTATQEILDKYAPVMDSLMAANELYHVFQEAARRRGNMDLSSDETKFVLDENGVCVQLLPRTTGEAEQLIEQMMIAANIAAAKAALKAEIPFLYRVHERPQPDRVDELAELLERLGIPCRELRKGKPSTKDFAAILDRVKDTPRASLVNQRVLRTMEKAHYADREIGHFGLALGEYSHFTSPIRRYPDTSIHRILSDLVAGADQTTLKKRYGEFATLSAAESSKTEVRAVTGERSAEDCYIAEYMKAHLGERHMGIISGVTPKGIFVKLENNAEGFVSLNDFENCEFEYDGEVSIGICALAGF